MLKYKETILKKINVFLIVYFYFGKYINIDVLIAWQLSLKEGDRVIRVQILNKAVSILHMNPTILSQKYFRGIKIFFL